MEIHKKYNPDLKENLIVRMTFNFALEIVKLVEKLESNRKYAVANQLIDPEHLLEQMLEKLRTQNLKLISFTK